VTPLLPVHYPSPRLFLSAQTSPSANSSAKIMSQKKRPPFRTQFARRAGTALALLATALAHAEQKGTAQRLLVANTGKVAIVAADGSIEREVKSAGLHDAALLANGNLLYQSSWTKITELNPAGQVVWEYDSAQANGNQGKPLEVHAFQRLENGLTMISESGIGRLIEVDRAGTLRREITLTRDKPSKHSDTRLVRRTPSGTYLVAHEADGKVHEYSLEGKVIWEYAVPLFGKERAKGHGPEAFGNSLFSAIRIQNGNTLIGTGNGHSILEVNPKGEIVWKIEQHDLPGITLAWVTRVERLPNGNTRFGNCHAGPNMPFSIEVNSAKQVVWTYSDFERFGNSTVAVDVVPALRAK
jgi:outer membrane protein assembly factor BamB